MQYNLAIFTQYSNAYAPTRLSQECAKAGIKSTTVSYSFLPLTLPKARSVILREPNSALNIYSKRDKILNFYLQNKTNVLNSQSYLTWSELDKLKQHSEFIKAEIPHLKLISIDEAQFPYVVKSKQGSHGDHVFKIENKGDLEKVFRTYKKSDLLMQEFQTSGFDVRAIVLGDKTLGIMKRIPKDGQFLSNYSQGGRVLMYEGEDYEKVSNIALKTAKHFKLDYAGVDLMIGNDGEWKVLEVNRGCQFKGFEKATGTNVARRLLAYLQH